jgi:hypothetical protein
MPQLHTLIRSSQPVHPDGNGAIALTIRIIAFFEAIQDDHGSLNH